MNTGLRTEGMNGTSC